MYCTSGITLGTLYPTCLRYSVIHPTFQPHSGALSKAPLQTHIAPPNTIFINTEFSIPYHGTPYSTHQRHITSHPRKANQPETADSLPASHPSLLKRHRKKLASKLHVERHAWVSLHLVVFFIPYCGRSLLSVLYTREYLY